jgi:sugar transferase (PEP-CTERM/EpsH1 system associated)
MNILFITHSFPYPIDEGIKIYSYYLLKELSKKHSITLLTFVESEQEKKYASEIKRFCRKIETVVHGVPKSPLKRLFNIFFQRTPFCVRQFYSQKMVRKLSEIIKNNKFDIVHFDYISMSSYRDLVGKLPSIFCLHDAMSMLFKRNISKERNLLRKLYTYSQGIKMKRYEAEVISKFNKTAVVSPVDMEYLLSYKKNLDITVIPNGVDYEYFVPLKIDEEYPSVVFRGIMSFLPNIDAALYFKKEILPLILSKIPNLKYFIVGGNPVKEIVGLKSVPNIEVSGYVEDIRPYMAKATVNICPMRIGSGIKNKILEAMSMAKPVVATKMACAGIDVTDGENILIADAPSEFTEKIITLFKDEKLREKIGSKAREFIVKNYTWQKTADMFEKVYKEAVSEI